MKNLFIISLTFIAMAFTSSTKNLHSFTAKTLEGKIFDFANLKELSSSFLKIVAYSSSLCNLLIYTLYLFFMIF
jgi:hypothetical protein